MVIVVHGPQLLLGFDSAMEPVHVSLKLAQERTLYEPDEEKVYELKTGTEAPAESAGMTAVARNSFSSVTAATATDTVLLIIVFTIALILLKKPDGFIETGFVCVQNAEFPVCHQPGAPMHTHAHACDPSFSHTFSLVPPNLPIIQE